MELKKAASDYYEQLAGAVEETFEPIEDGDGFLLSIIEPGPDETERTDSGDSQRNSERIMFYAYLRDTLREPLLTPNEEREISAKIKNCKGRIEKIKTLISKLSEQMKKGSLDGNRNGRQCSLSRQIETLNAFATAHSHMARKLRNRFIKANLRLVLHIAKRYTNKGLPMPDIFQEGNLGLMRAVDRFDHEKGVKFSTYASWWIHQSIIRAIFTQTETIKVPVYLLENSAKVYRTMAEQEAEMGRIPMPEEIAKRTRLSANAVRRIIETRIRTAHLHSSAIDVDKVSLLDLIADEGSPIPDSIIAKRELPEIMTKALSLLKPREAEVIRMRFGMNEENIVHTLDDTGKKFGLTRERIRQVEKKALKKIASSALGKALSSFRE